MLTGGRITDGEAGGKGGMLDEEEESVAGGQQIVTVIKLGDGFELAIGGWKIEGEEVFVVTYGAGDNGEGWLAIVVGKEEIGGGCGVAPGTANGAAAEEGCWGQTDEDLPDDNLLREASFPCDLGHGRRWGIRLVVLAAPCLAWLELYVPGI